MVETDQRVHNHEALVDKVHCPKGDKMLITRNYYYSDIIVIVKISFEFKSATSITYEYTIFISKSGGGERGFLDQCLIFKNIILS